MTNLIDITINDREYEVEYEILSEDDAEIISVKRGGVEFRSVLPLLGVDVFDVVDMIKEALESESEVYYEIDEPDYYTRYLF